MATTEETSAGFTPDKRAPLHITEGQLRRLGDMGKVPVLEPFLIAVGVFIGSLIPAIVGVIYFNRPTGATGAELISIVLCGSGFAVALVTGYQWHVRRKSYVDLEEEIRGYEKAPVKHTRISGWSGGDKNRESGEEPPSQLSTQSRD